MGEFIKSIDAYAAIPTILRVPEFIGPSEIVGLTFAINALANEPTFNLEATVLKLETLSNSLKEERNGAVENSDLQNDKHAAFLILMSYLDGIKLAQKYHRVGSGRRS